MAAPDQKITSKAAPSFLNDVQGIASLLELLVGKKGGTQTTSGGTVTEQTLFDATAADAMMRQLLGASGLKGTGRQGLAAVTRGEKSAGLYNSATQELLTNDLLSRITGEIAIAGAPKVTTATPKVTTGVGSQQGITSVGALGLGALALLAGSKQGRKKAGDLWDKIFGNSSSAGADLSSFGSSALTAMAPGGIGANSSWLNSGFDDADLFAGSGASVAELASLINPSKVDSSTIDAISAGFGALPGTLDIANLVGDQGGDALGSLISQNATNWGVDIAGDAASAGLDVGIPGIGSILNLVSGNNAGGAAGESAVLSTIPGVGPVLAVANSLNIPGISDVVDAGGNIIKDIGNAIGCFITTAIMKSLGTDDDHCTELTVLRQYRDTWLAKNHPMDIAEYYRIAPEIVSRIGALPDAEDVWHKLYLMHLVPALEEIAAGNFQQAYEVYKQMVIVAKEIV